MRDKPIGLEINRLANLIRREVDKMIHRTEMDKTTRSNGWIIRYIAEHPDQDVFQRDLEKEFSITRSTASKVVDLMEQKGMIVRSSVDYDARLKKLSLTPKAKRIHGKMKHGNTCFEQSLVMGFSCEEIEQLRSYLRRMEKNLNDDGKIIRN